MKDKLNRFVDNTVGQFIEVSYSPALYQCMDLAYNWIFCLDFPKSTIQHQYAYEVFTQASDFTRQYFDIIPNLKETIPQEGDLVVWNKTTSNVAGHIAVVVEATQDKMKVFEQNNPTGTNAHIQDRGYTNCLGFLRPKFSEPSGQPEWFKTMLLEKNLSLDREAEFRSFWEKALKYDGDVKSLQEQIKSTNEALADRALEVSTLTEKNQRLSDKVTETEEIINLVRNKNDTLSLENVKLEIEVEKLISENKTLQEKVDRLEAENSIFAYTWYQRLSSLFRRR